MSDPVLFCAIVYASFVRSWATTATSPPMPATSKASTTSSKKPPTSPTQLALCGGHEREIVLIAKLGRQAADQAHALEDRAQHDGTPLRNY